MITSKRLVELFNLLFGTSCSCGSLLKLQRNGKNWPGHVSKVIVFSFIHQNKKGSFSNGLIPISENLFLSTGIEE
jgi:hypothetical protein